MYNEKKRQFFISSYQMCLVKYSGFDGLLFFNLEVIKFIILHIKWLRPFHVGHYLRTFQNKGE